MAVTQKTVLKIECDNPNCPGNSLDPKSYDGWYRVSVTTQQTPPSIKGEPAPFAFPVSMGEQIFCSSSCAATIEQAIVADEEAREEAANPPQVEAQ